MEERRREEEETIADARLWSKKEILELKEDFHGLIMEVRDKVKELQELWRQGQNLHGDPVPNTCSRTGAGSTSRQIECLNCSAPHETDKCHSMLEMPLEKRVETLAKQFACYRCLRRGHIARYCKGKHFRCASCGLAHPTILHGLRQLKLQGKGTCN